MTELTVPLWDGSDTAELEGQRTFETTDLEIALSDLWQTSISPVWSTPMNNDADDDVGSVSGSTIGDATFSSGTKKVGSHSASYDGTGDAHHWGDILDSILAGADKKWSISAWVYVNALSGTQTIVSKYGDGNQSEDQRQILLDVQSTGYIRTFYSGALDGTSYRIIITTTGAISAGSWNHIVLTYDGSIDTGDGLDRVQVYVNNSSQTTSLSTPAGGLPDIPDGAGRLAVGGYVGSSGTTVANPLNGFVDSAIIFSNILTSGDVSILYNSGNGTEITSPTRYSATSPSPGQQWAALPAGTVVDMSTVFIPENMNAADAGTVKYKYAVNNGALNASWLTLTQLRAESDPTITNATNSLKIVPQYISDGTQITTSQAYATVDASLPAGGSNNMRGGFIN